MLLEEAVSAGERASKKTEELLMDFEQKMIDEGVTVNEVDVELFKEATSVVYEKIEGYQELREQVNELLGK